MPVYDNADHGIAPGQSAFTAPSNQHLTTPAQSPTHAASLADAVREPHGALIVGMPDGTFAMRRAHAPEVAPERARPCKPFFPAWVPKVADADREALANAHAAIDALPATGPRTVEQVQSATRAYLAVVRCSGDGTSVSLALSNLLSLPHRHAVMEAMPAEAVQHILDQVLNAGLTTDFQLASTCQALQFFRPERQLEIAGFDAHVMIILQGLTLLHTVTTPAAVGERFAFRFRTEIHKYPAIATVLVEALHTLHYHPLISKTVASLFCAMPAENYCALIQANAIPCIAVLIDSLTQQGDADAHVCALFSLLASFAGQVQSVRSNHEDMDRVNLAPLIVHHATISLSPLALLAHLISTPYGTHAKWREEMATPPYRAPLLSAVMDMMQSRVIKVEPYRRTNTRADCLLLVNILADLASHGPLRKDVLQAWMDGGLPIGAMFENDVDVQSAVRNLADILEHEYVSEADSPDSAAHLPSGDAHASDSDSNAPPSAWRPLGLDFGPGPGI